MIRYSSAGIHNCGHDAINEFKLLIREAHKRGIEVTLISMFCSILFVFSGLFSALLLFPNFTLAGSHGCGFQSHC